MKYLCCNENFSSAMDLNKHYDEFHTVDKNNYFFRKLFIRDKAFCPKTCFPCEEFLSDGREEKVYNFLKHYQQGDRLPSKDKPIKKTFFDSDTQKYCINFSENRDYYDFYDSSESIFEFLTVFENNSIPRRNLEPVNFKCSFTKLNHQPPPMPGFVEVIVARVWVTNVYIGV